MKRALFISLICLTLTTACVSKNTYQQKINETELLQRDVSRLEATTENLNREKDELDQTIAKLNDDLSRAWNENSKLNKQLIAVNATQNRQQGRLSQNQQQLADMQEQLASMQETNDQLLRALEKEKIAREARLAKVKSTYDQLVGALENEIKRGELTISNLEGQLSVNLLNNILFDSGKTVIKKEGRKVLKSLGDVLNKFPDKALQIEGHTDNVQISSRLKELYPTNWELSTARATSVVHFLQDGVGLPGERLVAAGYSEYRPLGENETPEGRASNRRIQIVLVPYKATE